MASLEIGNNNGLTLWDLKSGVQTRKLPCNGNAGPTLTFSSSGSWLVAACENQVRLWNLSDRAQSYVADFEDDAKSVGIAFCYDKNLLASAYANGIIRVRDLTDRRKVLEIRAEEPDRRAVQFSADCRLFASSISSREFVVWETQTWRPVKTIDGYATWGVMSFSTDGRQLFVPARNAIEIWDTTSWKRGAALPILPLHVFALASSSDGRFVATGGATLPITVWNVSDGHAVRNL